MSALGQKRTLGKMPLMSALPPKADMRFDFLFGLFGSRRKDCRDIVGSDSGAVRRPNKVLQSAGYIRGSEARVRPWESAGLWRLAANEYRGTIVEKFPLYHRSMGRW
jgi:hypothetical protein